MDSFVNECITGVYAHDGDAIVYGDTDSVYFSAWPILQAEIESGKIEWNKDICVQMYDSIADQVNESFPEMMRKWCHCPTERGALIKGGRELIATTGLFIKKKRYAVLIYDMEGTRLDQLDEADAKKKGAILGVGKVKAMGLDLKRSDTPKIVQDFLSDILKDALTHVPKEKVIEKIRTFKTEFAAIPAWEKGTPKRVNNLTTYGAKEAAGKANLPGHVRAALNWNNLRRMHSDSYSMQIVDGMKIIVCKLKNNPLGYTSVAYPIDVMHIPDWFKELPFDNDLMETTIVNQKVENLLSVLNWDLTNNTQINSKFDSLFSFD
jgi:DNA polymerase elongation subunit (family B)